MSVSNLVDAGWRAHGHSFCIVQAHLWGRWSDETPKGLRHLVKSFEKLG